MSAERTASGEMVLRVVGRGEVLALDGEKLVRLWEEKRREREGKRWRTLGTSNSQRQ